MVHLDIFAADVDLPEGTCLEAMMRQRGHGRVAIGLLDASDASMPLTGVTATVHELQVPHSIITVADSRFQA